MVIVGLVANEADEISTTRSLATNSKESEAWE
jgi:hypothetical protein